LVHVGGQIVEPWEKERYFTFWDLVIFGLKKRGIGCCFGR
jgi:hypothetical protein